MIKLNLGCGPNKLPGWLNTDIAGSPDQYLDISQPFPLADGSCSHVYGEQCIEHVDYFGAQNCIREAFRVLAPGGRIRLVTPDLQNLVELALSTDNDPGVYQIRELHADYTSIRPNARSGVVILNRMMRDWGHLFIWDEESLEMSLARSGFVDVWVAELGESHITEFDNIERHYPDGIVGSHRYESFAIEARKPS